MLNTEPEMHEVLLLLLYVTIFYYYRNPVVAEDITAPTVDDDDDDENDSFLYVLSESFINLSHSLPLIPSSSSLHWFLRQLSHYVPPHLIGRVCPILLQQLVGLSKERLSRDSSLTQLLLTK